MYARSERMKLPLPISEKIQKRLDFYMNELAIPEKLVPTERVEQAYEELRRNLIIYSSLKKHQDKKLKEKENLEKIFETQNKNSMKKSSIIHISQHPQYTNINGKMIDNKDTASVMSKEMKKSSKKVSLIIKFQRENSMKSSLKIMIFRTQIKRKRKLLLRKRMDKKGELY